MTPEQSTKLRAEFPRERIHQLPKGGVMLDFVGHADVTDRLLEVDPEWYWEPFAVDAQGLPACDYVDGKPVGMWIRLTVCGTTRIGYGSVAQNAFDAKKQLVGDALRNAAMRFGVALDLWSKSDLHDDQHPQERPSPAAQRVPQAVSGAPKFMAPPAGLDHTNFNPKYPGDGYPPNRVAQEIIRDILPDQYDMEKQGSWKDLLAQLPASGLLKNDVIGYIGGTWAPKEVDEFFGATKTSLAAVFAAAREGKS